MVGVKEFIYGGMAKDTHMDFILETNQNLGNIEVVILGIEGKMNYLCSWFVNSAIIYNISADSNTETEFPCYHWITDAREVAITAATCKCMENIVLVAILPTELTQACYMSYVHDYIIMLCIGLGNVDQDI